MPEERTKDPMVKLFGLWENKSKDGTMRYWSGIIGGVKILMYRCKSEHPQAPMFEVYVAPFRKKKDRTDKPADTDNYSATPNDQSTQEAAPAPAVNPGDEELPF